MAFQMKLRIVWLNLIILDANVIIELFRQDIFAAVVDRCSIKLPTTIKNECKFYEDQSGKEIQIDWTQYLNSGKVEEISADDLEYGKLARLFKEDFYRGIDAGGLEALAIINASDDEYLFFCSGDLPSLKAMGVLGKGNQAVSLEKLLKNIGIQKNLKQHFSEKRKNQEVGKAFTEKEMYLK